MTSSRAGFSRGRFYGKFARVGTEEQNVLIGTGSANTRAAVLADLWMAPIGSLYFSSVGKFYVRVSNDGDEEDFEKVTLEEDETTSITATQTLTLTQNLTKSSSKPVVEELTLTDVVETVGP